MPLEYMNGEARRNAQRQRERESSVRCHPDWVTCPICQCDMAEVLSEHPEPDQIKHLAMGYCSAECFGKSK